MKEIILASSSIYKRQLLESIGVTFRSISPDVDESRLSAENPRDYVSRLSEAKARKLLDEFPDAICIGADQCVALEDEILGKAPDYEKAFIQLKKMQGKIHELITGVSIVSSEYTYNDMEIHRMHMRKLTDEAISRYITTQKPFDTAGCYKIEGMGISLFEKIEGNDPRAIIGLPLMKIVSIFNNIGIIIP